LQTFLANFAGSLVSFPFYVLVTPVSQKSQLAIWCGYPLFQEYENNETSFLTMQATSCRHFSTQSWFVSDLLTIDIPSYDKQPQLFHRQTGPHYEVKNLQKPEEQHGCMSLVKVACEYEKNPPYSRGGPYSARSPRLPIQH
jgi:hypothetical protein